MFKTSHKCSTTSRRVRMARSVATSHADTATGPRPIVSRPSAAVTKRGPSRSRVRSPEQSIEPLLPRPPEPHKRPAVVTAARSHSQDRDVRMTNTAATTPPAPGAVYVGIDVSKGSLDVARSDAGDGKAVQTFSNDAAAIRRIVELLANIGPP